MPIYHVGELDEQITLSRKTYTDDGAGGDIVTLEPVEDVLAKVVFKSGVERDEGDQMEAQRTFEFVIHKRDDVIPESWAVTWGSQDFNIRFVNPAKKRSDWWQILECEQGVAI